MKYTFTQPCVNRQDRRKAEREQRRANFECKRYADMTPEERKQAELYEKSISEIERNGITRADLSREYDRGVREGIRIEQEIMQHKDYAALAMAVKEVLKLGPERTVRVLNAYNRILLELIPNNDLVDEYLNKCGIQIDDESLLENEFITKKA